MIKQVSLLGQVCRLIFTISAAILLKFLNHWHFKNNNLCHVFIFTQVLEERAQAITWSNPTVTCCNPSTCKTFTLKSSLLPPKTLWLFPTELILKTSDRSPCHYWGPWFFSIFPPWHPKNHFEKLGLILIYVKLVFKFFAENKFSFKICNCECILSYLSTVGIFIESLALTTYVCHFWNTSVMPLIFNTSLFCQANQPKQN